jgi:hypothetical protein
MIAYVVMLLVVAGTIEGMAWAVGSYLATKAVFYVPEKVEGYARYLALRDPVVGWPMPSTFGTGERDDTGSRAIPAFADTRVSCVSLYGDSFTWGSEVDNEHAWSNVLSELLGCRVSNFGVSGYGTDQAYLRFLHNSGDRAPVVILGHLSLNIIRNVNQMRGLVSFDPYGLKPRFILTRGGQLELVPLPTFTETDYRGLVQWPAGYLRHEYFLPGEPAGSAMLRFPFTLSVLGALQHRHIRAQLSGTPHYLEFYDGNHPSGALLVTTAIIKAFTRDVTKAGRTPVVIIIPAGLDLQYYAKHGRWVYQPLLDRLQDADVNAFDTGPGIMNAVGSRDPCELLDKCGGHYNDEGNAVLAQIVFNRLRTEGVGGRRDSD